MLCLLYIYSGCKIHIEGESALFPLCNSRFLNEIAVIPFIKISKCRANAFYRKLFYLGTTIMLLFSLGQIEIGLV